ncbi:MAG: hypothetical protein ABI680_02050, partial [Chthoniobacteraceae bacterium]
MSELEAMEPRFSQWLPGEEIPEQHWMYRWAKKYWFNDFNAYAHAEHDATARSKVKRLRSAGSPTATADAVASPTRASI